VIERDLQPFENVVPRLGLAQLELGPAADDLAPEVHEALDQLEQIHDLRAPADDGEHDDPEAHLQLRVLVEVVEHDLRHLTALQLDHDPHPVAIGLVAQIGDALNGLLAHELGDPLDQLGFVDLVRDLRHDDRLAIAFLVRLDLRLGAHQDRAAPGGVGLDGPLPADDLPGRREVRRRNQTNQGPQLVRGGGPRRSVREVRVLDQPDAAVDHLAQVVRRDVGRHADGDAGRSIDEQIRKRRGQHRRLFGGLVVVGDEIDGLLVEIRHHVVAERLEPSLGVPHRRRRIAVDRSEVALAVHQRIAHVEVLRHPDERVVDRLVAVGMEVPHHLADDLRALAVAARRRQPHGLHAVQDAAVCGLQPVACIGQRSSNDHAHGVIHVRPLHFVFDVDGALPRNEICHLV
jgi:hypothetical protein